MTPEDQVASNFLDSIVENIPDMIFVKDAQDLRFVKFNKAGEKLLGFTREELIGKNDYDFFPKQEADFFTYKDRQVLESGSLLDIPEELIQTKHGPRYLHTKKIPIMDSAGKPKYLLGISEDITEKKALEQKLVEYTKDLEAKVIERTQKIEEQIAKDKALIESIGEGIIAIDTKNIIMVMNKKAEEMLGFGHEEAIGISLDNILSVENQVGEKISFADQAAGKALATGTQQVSAKDSYFVHRNKTRFPVMCTASPVVEDGKTIGAILVFRDISKEKEIDHAKDEFISLVSHELRTPLTLASWYTERFTNMRSKLSREKQDEYVNEISQSMHRMIDLVNVIVEISRIDLGQFHHEISEVDLVKITEETLKEMRRDIEEKKIKIETEFSEDVHKALLDRKTVNLILHNLLANAIKYNRNEGTVKISIHKEGENMKIAISDTGYGIPKEEHSKIFSRLFRAKKAKELSPNGTGLGLYITKKFVSQSGGDIRFESEEGKGSTFYITLPLGTIAK